MTALVPMRVLLGLGPNDPWPFDMRVMAEHEPREAFLEAWARCSSGARVQALIEAYRLTPGPGCAVSFELDVFGHHLRLCYADATVNLSLDNNPDLAQYYRNKVSTHALDELIDRVLDAGLDTPLPP